MKLALREEMSRGRTLAERLAWLDGLGFEGIELTTSHLDFRPGFAALKEVGYDGYLGIECRISGPYDEALAECATLLRELWEAV